MFFYLNIGGDGSTSITHSGNQISNLKNQKHKLKTKNEYGQTMGYF
jgi:hypothetical protein